MMQIEKKIKLNSFILGFVVEIQKYDSFNVVIRQHEQSSRTVIELCGKRIVYIVTFRYLFSRCVVSNPFETVYI